MLYARFTSLVFVTTRWQTLGREDADALFRAGKPFITAFWHGRLMMSPHGWQAEQTVHVIISRHPDGENIARAMRHLGLEADPRVAHPRRRGGAAGIAAPVEGRGLCCHLPGRAARPPDAAQLGTIALARLSGAPIVPLTFAVSRRKVARSWDRFVIALPFSRGVYAWGPPLYVAANADESAQEDARLTLEERLNALTAEADRMVGAEPIEPAGDTPRAAARQAGPATAGARP